MLLVTVTVSYRPRGFILTSTLFFFQKGYPFTVRSVRASASMSEAAACLASMRVPNSSPPVPRRASVVTALVAATVPVWSLTVVTLRALGPPSVSTVASLSRGGQPSATATAEKAPATAGVAWRTAM